MKRNKINPHDLKKAYISIAMTGMPGDNLEKGQQAFITLKELGYWVYLPHNLTDYVESVIPIPQYKHYIGYDLWILSRCDLMFLIPGYEKSNGCSEEITFALKYNIPIFNLDGNLITNFKNIAIIYLVIIHLFFENPCNC